MILRLRGAHKGRTITLHGVYFVEGRAEVPEEKESLRRLLRRYYQALPDGEPDPTYEEEGGGDQVGHSESKTSKSRPDSEDNPVRSDVPPTREESNATPTDDRPKPITNEDRNSRLETNRGGPENSRDDTASEIAKVRSAILSMDPEDDSIWTSDNQAQVKVVAGMLGVPTISRTRIIQLAPDCLREFVRENGVRG